MSEIKTEPHLFKTIEDDVDSHFKKFVKETLEEVCKRRRNRPAAKPGFKYKRDWYDRMLAEDMLSSEFFIDNIKLIWSKNSTLSSEVRRVIQYVCDIALQKTMAKYSKQKP